MISGVDSVAVGIDNANIEVYSETKAKAQDLGTAIYTAYLGVVLDNIPGVVAHALQLGQAGADLGQQGLLAVGDNVAGPGVGALRGVGTGISGVVVGLAVQDGDVIAAVVVGEDSGATTNLVYTHKGMNSETDNNAADSRANASKGTYLVAGGIGAAQGDALGTLNGVHTVSSGAQGLIGGGGSSTTPRARSRTSIPPGILPARA